MNTESHCIRELLNRGERHLVDNGVPNARKNVEWILGHVLYCRSTDLYLTAAETPPDGKVQDFEHLVRRRGAREPLQYILGSTEFMGLSFRVVPGVFIPRPDTEVLVEKTEALITAHCARPRIVLDLCSGTGVIAVSLVRRLEETKAVAVDLAPEAVALAIHNARLNGVEHAMNVICEEAGRYLAGCERKFDAVVCNPPYVPRREMSSLPPEIRLHEPELSLAGGDDGLDSYRRFIPLIRCVLKPRGIVAFETGQDQSRAVSDLLREVSFVDVEIHRDFSGSNRVVVATGGV